MKTSIEEKYAELVEKDQKRRDMLVAREQTDGVALHDLCCDAMQLLDELIEEIEWSQRKADFFEDLYRKTVEKYAGLVELMEERKRLIVFVDNLAAQNSTGIGDMAQEIIQGQQK